MNSLFYENNIRFRIVRHILFFTLTVLLFTLIIYVQNGNDSFVNKLWVTLLNAIFFFGYAYITIFLLIPEFLLKRKVGWFVILFALIGIALSALKLVVSDHIFYSSIAPENISSRGFIELKFIVVNTKDMTFIVALFCIAKYVKDYLYVENIRKRLELENKAAQSKLIQSQFNPHFLFNTINNLYALSLLNPSKTKEVIYRIKIVLKYIIEEIQKDFVQLKDEMALVENYIQLEKLRYGQRLQVKYTVEGELERSVIPPMIMFFLVENCFKHGSSLDAGTPWINISLKTSKDKIYLCTENSKPSSAVKDELLESRNIELEHLQKRLSIIYSRDGYNLKISNRDSSFKVNLELSKGIELYKNKYR